uniref:Complex III subunit 9 n=2 Tax=Glossina TaxID=7393 RepID=A0A1B0GBS7_GLOMM
MPKGENYLVYQYLWRKVSKLLAKMKVLYNSLFKRTSTYAIGIMFSAFFFERTFDVLSETIFESANKGKLWKDIKHKYE